MEKSECQKFLDLMYGPEPPQNIEGVKLLSLAIYKCGEEESKLGKSIPSVPNRPLKRKLNSDIESQSSITVSICNVM